MRWLLCVLVFSFAAQADELTIVETALREEIAEFEAIEERWTKHKLKGSERLALFGKKTLTKQQQRERLDEIRTQVEAGEVSFRLLSLKFDEIKIGSSGVVAPNFQPITCTSSADRGNQFAGGYTFNIRLAPDVSKPMIFVNVPGGDSMIPGKKITIDAPLIVTGRRGETFVFESFAAAVKRAREAKAKKRD